MRWRAAQCTDVDVMQSLEEIQKEQPDDPRIECSLGCVRTENADCVRAVAHFEKAIESGDNTEARRGLEQARPLADSGAGQCLRSFEGHQRGVTSVAFSPDSRFALSGGGDMTLRIWEIDWEYAYDPQHDPVLRGPADGARSHSLLGRLTSFFARKDRKR
jgi:WD40 repeat protein